MIYVGDYPATALSTGGDSLCPMTRIGAHVDQQDPIAEAQARGTDLVQFFLGNPQGYKGPELEYAGGPRRCAPTRRRRASTSTSTRPT